jgi:hypothetical protein
VHRCQYWQELKDNGYVTAERQTWHVTSWYVTSIFGVTLYDVTDYRLQCMALQRVLYAVGSNTQLVLTAARRVTACISAQHNCLDCLVVGCLQVCIVTACVVYALLYAQRFTRVSVQQ